MRQLSEEELNAKIANFMRDRMKEHPELAHSARDGQPRQQPFTGVVSRVNTKVREWGDRLGQHYSINSTLYQV